MADDALGMPMLAGGERLRVEDVDPRGRGGGDKACPWTVEEAAATLGPQVAMIREGAASLDARLRASGQLYVEARLLANYLAASYFPGNLMDEIGAVAVGSRQVVGERRFKDRPAKPEVTKTLVLAVPDAGLRRLSELIEAPPEGRSAVAARDQLVEIDKLELPTASRIARLGTRDTGTDVSLWEAVLHPDGRRGDENVPASTETLSRWMDLVRGLGGEVLDSRMRVVKGLTFVPVRATRQTAERLAAFNPLRSLRPMPRIRRMPAYSGQTAAPVLVGNQRVESGLSKVVVFDGGVQSGKVVRPDVTGDLVSAPADDVALAHGTAVTGAVLYGNVVPGQVVRRLSVPVESYRVLGVPATGDDVDAYDTLEAIERQLEGYEHCIVNLSLGPEYSVDPLGEPDLWTSTLDRLAWEKDILFVVAAGNSGELEIESQRHIQPPADMVNGLSVGACDAPFPDSPWSRSSYSSIGPGRAGSIVQPAGVQFGGSRTRPFMALEADGVLHEELGTSFAAPVVTHGLAEASARLDRVNASLLKALGVHFAEPARHHRKYRDEVGYGRFPLSFADRLRTAPGEVTVLYTDEIARKELMVYRLPVPQDVLGPVTLRMTLVYLCPVDPAEAIEYTQADLEMHLRPHRWHYSYSLGKASRVLDDRSAEARELIADGWSRTSLPITAGLTRLRRDATEGELRDSGKWETVRRLTAKTFEPDEIFDPQIELSYIARHAGRLSDDVPPIPFSIVATIEAKEDPEVYDKVRRQFAQLRPALRSRTRVGLRSVSDTLPHWR